MWKLFLATIAFVASVIFIHRVTSVTEAPSVFHAPDVLANPYAVIAHGGGAIDGYAATNSQEAVEQSIRRGLKSIEVDLRQTRDGRFIGQHDEARFTAAGVDDTSKLAPDDLFALKLYGKYHPVSGDDLNRIFLADPSLVLVTDKTSQLFSPNRKIPLSGSHLRRNVHRHPVPASPDIRHCAPYASHRKKIQMALESLYLYIRCQVDYGKTA